jgi:hypothetical protein
MGATQCPEHPVVENLLRTGQPDGKDPIWHCCPVCGAEAERVFFSHHLKEYVGCDICLVSHEAWELLED